MILTRSARQAVSIHSPRRSEGRTARALVGLSLEEVFNHSPRRSEGRLASLRNAPALAKFQSTPPAEARETTHLAPPELSNNVSIHSPRRSEGRRPVRARARGCPRVSIHSPRRSEGRPVTAPVFAASAKFQSTPPAEARGDDREERKTIAHVKFQSTPPAEARGDSRPRKAGFNSSLWVAFRDTRLATCSHRSKESENMLLTRLAFNTFKRIAKLADFQSHLRFAAHTKRIPCGSIRRFYSMMLDPA